MQKRLNIALLNNLYPFLQLSKIQIQSEHNQDAYYDNLLTKYQWNVCDISNQCVKCLSVSSEVLQVRASIIFNLNLDLQIV